jgi:hypothetical protein
MNTTAELDKDEISDSLCKARGHLHIAQFACEGLEDGDGASPA